MNLRALYNKYRQAVLTGGFDAALAAQIELQDALDARGVEFLWDSSEGPFTIAIPALSERSTFYTPMSAFQRAVEVLEGDDHADV